MKAFLGAMTPNGFINRFNEIIPIKAGNKLFLLKGGNGVGKSTFLKKVAGNAISKGFSVDTFPCSNDPGSLDGILIKEKNLALIDATSPHLIDPRAYGFFDEIIDLGKSLNVDDKYSLEEIVNAQREKQVFINAFLRYFKAAKEIYDDIDENALSDLDIKLFNKKVSELNLIFPKCGKKTSSQKMFISAITPDGYLDFIKENSENCKTIKLDGAFDSVLSNALEELKKHLVENGYTFVEFLNNFEPTKPLAIKIEDTNTLVFYNSFVKQEGAEAQLEINFSKLSSKNSQLIENNKSVAILLLNHASNLLKNSSIIHNRIEKLFFPFVDFQKSDLVFKDFIKREL